MNNQTNLIFKIIFISKLNFKINKEKNYIIN